MRETESDMSYSQYRGRPPRAPKGLVKNRSSMGLIQAGRRIAHKTSRVDFSSEGNSPLVRAAYTGARQRSALMNRDGMPLTTAEFIRAKD